LVPKENQGSWPRFRALAPEGELTYCEKIAMQTLMETVRTFCGTRINTGYE
jgi:hypothetical protein